MEDQLTTTTQMIMSMASSGFAALVAGFCLVRLDARLADLTSKVQHLIIIIEADTRARSAREGLTRE